MAQTAKTLILLLEVAERTAENGTSAFCGAMAATLGFLIGVPWIILNQGIEAYDSIGLWTTMAPLFIAACAAAGYLLHRGWVRLRWIRPLRERLRLTLDGTASPWGIIQLAQSERKELFEKTRPLYGIDRILDSYKPFNADDIVC